ncbi:MAG: hypothetical protein Q8K32_19190 [Archangium sp.]|nr:hypothetical protein [Archangium sp.]
MSTTRHLEGVSRFFGAFRWAFMPLGLFALVAVGVHAAADVVDDKVLRLVEALDVFFDGFFAEHEATAAWVNKIDSRERTLFARGFALAWELAVDAFIALPALGYDELDEKERRFSLIKETWRTLLRRVNQQPTPMRLVRPFVTSVFVFGGAYAVSRLVESTLFVGLVGDVAPADVAAPVARILAGTAMTIVLFSHAWRAVLRSLQHADETCIASKHPWMAGLWGSVLSFPLALALLLEAEALLSFFR